MSKSIVRGVKNMTKGYSSVQVKVRNATSNDSWGPSGTEMSEIAQMTFNNSGDFAEIMEMLDKRLNDKGKNWRHVLKSLKVLDYCLHEGSEMVVTWARKNIYIIKTLREFIYVDEDGRDVGQNVRVSAKELTSLILDEDRLRAERHDRKLWKTRVTGLDDGPIAGYAGGSDANNPPPRVRARTNRSNDDDDLEYRLAIEASKNEAEEDRKRREAKIRTTASTANGDNDDDLAKALKLSREEEELRKRELEEQNAASLFDDAPAQSQATGWNQGYQQQGAVDWFGNPVEQQQPQSTGYLNNAYAQQPGLQSQPTGFQNPYAYNPYQQPMQTGFDQSQYQQQPAYMQPQQTAFTMNNPYNQQPMQQPQQQQQQQQQPVQQPGSHNPWASNSSADSLRPQPTGSNNPFGSSFGRPPPAQKQQTPTLSTLSEQRAQTDFSQAYNPQPSFASQQATQQKPQNPQYAHLNALLASGEGQDTFGNTGNMRIPAQHTAPGTFVNSAGAGLNRLQANQTGMANPYLQSQYTGMPMQSSMMPAQTGPAGGFGGASYGSTNPFGQRSVSQPHPQGGSLIDL